MFPHIETGVGSAGCIGVLLLGMIKYFSFSADVYHVVSESICGAKFLVLSYFVHLKIVYGKGTFIATVHVVCASA